MMAVQTARTEREDLIDESGNVLFSVERPEPTPPLPETLSAPREDRLHSYAQNKFKGEGYDPRPQNNLNKLRGRNFKGAVKSQFRGKGRTPS